MLSIRRGKVARRANQNLAWHARSEENTQSLDESIREVIRAEDVEQVRLALGELNPDLRVIVQLRIYEGLKFSEIAQRLDVPLGTVLTRMRNSLAKLRMKLNERE